MRFAPLATVVPFCLLIGCSDSGGVGPSGGPPGTGGGARSTEILQNGTRFEVRCGGHLYAGFTPPTLGGQTPITGLTDAGDGWYRVSMRWPLDRVVAQDDLAVAFDVSLQPDFQWIPHLAPVDGLVVGQHVFRSPAIVLAQADRTLALVPDLAHVGRVNPWYLDWDAPNGVAKIGMSEQDVPIPVLYRKLPGMSFPRGDVELGFFVRAWEDHATPRNPWRPVASFLWDRFGSALWRSGAPDIAPMEQYIDEAHAWLFGRWRDPVWHEFNFRGDRVGGAVNLVDVTQSPSYRGGHSLPLELSVWNQAWFSALRAAAGRFRWARRTADGDLFRTAELCKALALAAPQVDGLFPSVLLVEEPYQRGVSEKSFDEMWRTAVWTGSDRTPKERGVTREWYRIADMSWTALQMLRWHRELEPDPDLLDYVRAFADRLLELQDDRGFFPAWLHPTTQEPSEILFDSPESSLPATFLLELDAVLPDRGYRESALQALDAVLAGPAAEGRWEDFETFWSNSFLGITTHLGRRWVRNGIYKQNNLSIFWTAEAALRAFEVTGEPTYFDWGRRTLDELSMYQQVWEPPFIHVPALGGFGVMNADGEWNDARQSMFAELLLEYYRVTGETELFERGVAALRASWAMMYSPLNPRTQAQWQAAHPFLTPADHGFQMENYGHDGATNSRGLGMGWFSIYTWGAGAATEAYTRVVDDFGHVYVDRRRGHAFGIDGIVADYSTDGIELVDVARRTPTPRTIRIVFEDGSDRWIVLDGETVFRP